MGEEETKTEVPEAAANGNGTIDKPVEAVTEKKEEEIDGVEKMEEDKKDDVKAETQKMDEDLEVKEDMDSKEEEEPETEAMEEDTDAKEKEESKEEVDEKAEEPKKEEEKMEERKELKGLKVRVKGKSGGEKAKVKKKDVKEKKEPEPRTPTIDRPVRERKCVERLVASVEKDSVKEVQIEKGRGTPLKDIPNVAFKLSRKKTEDTFKLLHSILFGRRGKAFQIKSNMSRFSGFVWHENEEKQKNKIKEKFDKCNKEKLLEFCDVLDIPIAKATTRKEDVVTKLIDFLVAPHATTAGLLAEKEKSSSKGTKRKRVTKRSSSGSTPSKRSAKSRRKAEDSSKMEKKSTSDTEDESEEEDKEEDEEEEEENENGVPEKSEDEKAEPSESEEKIESEDESEEDVGKQKRSARASSKKKESAVKAKTKKITVSNKSSPPAKKPTRKSSSKRSKADDDSDTSPKVFSRKKKNEKVAKEKSSIPLKPPSKERSGKRVSKGKGKAKEEKQQPSDDGLRDAICEILKEVDFNTATFTDILKQLAKQFDTDLTPRKSSIKLMIQEELTKLADDEDGEGDAEKDENLSAGQEVEV